jgi:hypothetical protein
MLQAKVKILNNTKALDENLSGFTTPHGTMTVVILLVSWYMQLFN